jgi:hypothetical protein
MGQAILYCYRCSTQLRESHFAQGKAFRLDSRGCCLECVPEAIKTLPPDLVRQLLSQAAAKPPAASPPSPVLRHATPRQAFPAVRGARPKPPTLWIAVGIGAAVIVALLAVVLSPGNASPERGPRPENPVSKLPPPPREKTPPPDGPARQALAGARTYAREHPDDLFGQLRAFEDLTLQADQTDAGAEARKVAQALRARGKESVERALAALNGELSLLLGREEFGAAIDALESAKARMEWPDWKFALDKRIREVQTQVDGLYEPLRAKAMDAKAKGDAPGVESAVSRVRQWGSRRLANDLSEALAGIASPPVRVAVQDFEGTPTGWGFVGGQEFPGAKGSATVDASVSRGGRRAYKLQADFTGGGMYVGFWCDLASLKERDVKEIRLWLKTSTISRIGVRLADNTDQCHQKNGGVALAPSTEWQELVLRIPELVGGEHWGGANDGRWHGPIKGFGLNVGKGTFRNAGESQGTLWIDDVDMVVVPSISDR